MTCDLMARDRRYVMSEGQNGQPGTTVWRGNTIEYRRRTRFFDAANYDTYPLVESRPNTVSDGAGAAAK
jgi:hypothetical protein